MFNSISVSEIAIHIMMTETIKKKCVVRGITSPTNYKWSYNVYKLNGHKMC